ncbi:hypothetical protein D3C77_760860 [compost metagenome]
MRQAVGLRLQFGPRHLSFIAHSCNGVRACLGLLAQLLGQQWCVLIDGVQAVVVVQTLLLRVVQ